MKRQTKRFYIYVMLTIGIMIFIFLFSNQDETESVAVSDSTLKWVLQENAEWMPAPLILFLKKKIRKVAHFLIYCALGITSCLSIHEYCWKKNYTGQRKNIIALVLCAVYACTDEFHQYFIPGRSCEIKDVCLDSAGALCGILFVWLILKLIDKIRK